MATWSEASSEVIDRASSLIRKYHPELMGHISIAFIFRSVASYSKGRPVIGKCAKFPDKLRPFLDYDVLIWIAEEEYSKLSDEQRNALIDHELCHIKYYKDTERFILRGHDVEEFYEIIERYGAWDKTLHRLAQMTDQLKLPISVDVEYGDAKPIVQSLKIGEAELAVLENVEAEA